MSQHLMTVCVFCLLCATHAPCSAHTELMDQKTLQYYNNGLTYPHRMNLSDPPSVKFKKLLSENDDILHYIGNEDKYANEVVKQVIVNKKPNKFGNKDDQRGPLNVNDDVRIENSRRSTTSPIVSSETDTPLNEQRGSQLVRQKRIRKSISNGETGFDKLYYIRKIFNIYNRTEDILPLADFKRLVDRLGLQKFFQNTDKNSLNHKNNKTCITGEHILEKLITYHEHDQPQHFDKNNSNNSTTNDLTVEHFQLICPLLVYQMAADSSEERLGCIIEPDKSFHAGKVNSLSNAEDTPSANQQEYRDSIAATWIYATISVIIISACGLLGVVVIPVMQKHFYHQLLQFLVALAIGTLCGDALLHLLPHAMLSHQHDSHTSTTTGTNGAATVVAAAAALHQHNQSIWKGFAAMLGVIFFYFVEKFLTLGAEWRKRRQRRHKFPSKVRVMRDNDSVGNNSVGEKLCKHKYSSYPYCYDEIATQDDAHNRGNNISRKNNVDNSGIDSVHNSTNVTMLSTYEELGVNSLKKKSMQHQPSNKTETNQNDLNIELKNSKETDAMFENNKTDLPRTDLQLSEEESYTVILREHESKHHGHSHAHGHVHAAPDSLSSVAWMVIMGDGLHNFTDGMAIGAAFASGIAGGVSTSVAVFCHELPHEIGDFAVLLKAGMSAKQAMFYNLLSSVLCFFGCLLGVTIGHSNSANEWVFAVAGGMFIYIALVDMIPELTSSHSKEGGSLLQCLLQFCGLMSGLAIMTLIAVYEHSIKTMFEHD